eukprot:3174191-Heterocapsa_arctica.AAC.1
MQTVRATMVLTALRCFELKVRYVIEALIQHGIDTSEHPRGRAAPATAAHNGSLVTIYVDDRMTVTPTMFRRSPRGPHDRRPDYVL